MNNDMIWDRSGGGIGGWGLCLAELPPRKKSLVVVRVDERKENEEEWLCGCLRTGP